MLAPAGVEPEAIAADYALNDERPRPLYLCRGQEDEGPKIAAFLEEQGTTAGDAIVALLADFDLEATLRAATPTWSSPTTTSSRSPASAS